MKNFLMLSLFLFTGVVSMAQTQNNVKPKPENKPNPEAHAKKLTGLMTQTLTLTASQQQPIYDINLKYAKLNMELRQSGLSQKEYTQKRKQNSVAKENELKAVLTAEQFKLYLAKKQQMQAQMKEENQQNKNVKGK